MKKQTKTLREKAIESLFNAEVVLRVVSLGDNEYGVSAKGSNATKKYFHRKYGKELKNPEIIGVLKKEVGRDNIDYPGYSIGVNFFVLEEICSKIKAGE